MLFGVPFVFLIEGPGLRIAGIYKYISSPQHGIV